jgi:hypothetical protein
VAYFSDYFAGYFDAVASSVVSGVGESAGVATIEATGASIAEAVGESAGTSEGVSAGDYLCLAEAAGAATADGVGESTAEAEALAEGSCEALGVAEGQTQEEQPSGGYGWANLAAIERRRRKRELEEEADRLEVVLACADSRGAAQGPLPTRDELHPSRRARDCLCRAGQDPARVSTGVERDRAPDGRRRF